MFLFYFSFRILSLQLKDWAFLILIQKLHLLYYIYFRQKKKSCQEFKIVV